MAVAQDGFALQSAHFAAQQTMLQTAAAVLPIANFEKDKTVQM
jgi:hypothetical protein